MQCACVHSKWTRHSSLLCGRLSLLGLVYFVYLRFCWFLFFDNRRQTLVIRKAYSRSQQQQQQHWMERRPALSSVYICLQIHSLTIPPSNFYIHTFWTYWMCFCALVAHRPACSIYCTCVVSVLLCICICIRFETKLKTKNHLSSWNGIPCIRLFACNVINTLLSTFF